MSRSSRVAVAANCPGPLGNGNSIGTPDGRVIHTLVSGFQVGTSVGSRPRCSRCRSAPAVRPSPQHLSRGNTALSITVTVAPDLRSTTAAAAPAGPAPTMTTDLATQLIVLPWAQDRRWGKPPAKSTTNPPSYPQVRVSKVTSRGCIAAPNSSACGKF